LRFSERMFSAFSSLSAISLSASGDDVE
jgi:hypothetical protein